MVCADALWDKGLRKQRESQKAFGEHVGETLLAQQVLVVSTGWESAATWAFGEHSCMCLTVDTWPPGAPELKAASLPVLLPGLCAPSSCQSES